MAEKADNATRTEVEEAASASPQVVERIFPVVGTVDKATCTINGPRTAAVVPVENDKIIIISRKPRLILYPRFITSAESTEIMTLASTRFTQSMIGRGGDDARREESRTSLTAYLNYDETPTVTAVLQRAAKVMGVPASHIERFQVAHYSPGQHYKPHWDCYDADTEEGKRAIAQGYQRVSTLLVYLFAPPKGVAAVEAAGGDTSEAVAEGAAPSRADDTNGHTLFPLLGVSVVPTTCGAVFFDNACSQTLEQFDAALHAASPVTSGEKWVLNIWAHARPVDDLEAFEAAARGANAQHGDGRAWDLHATGKPGVAADGIPEKEGAPAA